MIVLEPAANPCGTCPYRRDVPSGVWSAEEYEKLPDYDRSTGDQPPAVFLCHQQNGRLCAGWAGCHDMADSLGLRVAAALGSISPEAVDATLDFKTSVPLFSSGAEAAEHGLADIANPSSAACRKIDLLSERLQPTTSARATSGRLPTLQSTEGKAI